MFTLHFSVQGLDEARAVVLEMARPPDFRIINTLMGTAVLQATREHLYGMANTRHRPHVASNFYKAAGDAAENVDLPNGVEVRIDKAGFAQRYYGGTIKAVKSSHLWIPIEEESEGKSPGEFEGLVKIINKRTNRGVAVMPGKDPETGKPSVALGTALFALVPEVEQETDPSVLPTDEEYGDAIVAAVDEVYGLPRGGA